MIHISKEAVLLISELRSITDWLHSAGTGPGSDRSIKNWHEAIICADITEYVNFRIGHINTLIRKEREFFGKVKKEKHLPCYRYNVGAEVLDPALSLILSIPKWPKISLKEKGSVAGSVIGNFACAIRAMMIGEVETNFFRQCLSVYMSGYFVCGANVRPDGTYQLVKY
jgi:hypothetical protein